MVAYSYNLIGSLLGIIVFFITSLLWLPPFIWFLLSAIALFPFVYNDQVSFIISVISMVLVIIILSVPTKLNEFEIYSPYQNITLQIYKSGGGETFDENRQALKMNILTSNRYLQGFTGSTALKRICRNY